MDNKSELLIIMILLRKIKLILLMPFIRQEKDITKRLINIQILPTDLR